MLARPTVITVAHPNVDVVLWRNCHFLLRSIRGHGSALEGKGRRAKRCAGKEMKARSRCWISNPRPSAEQQDYEGSEQSSRSKQRCTTTVSQLRLSNYAGTDTPSMLRAVQCATGADQHWVFFFFMRCRRHLNPRNKESHSRQEEQPTQGSVRLYTLCLHLKDELRQALGIATRPRCPRRRSQQTEMEEMSANVVI